jgi:hypothetical protein
MGASSTSVAVAIPGLLIAAVAMVKITALLADASIAAWWVMPPAMLGLLALSIRRAARGASR